MEKGAASLLAIILIIAFTIIAGAMVYLFSQKITIERIEDVEQDEGCDEINIRILEACYNDAQIKIKVESQSSKSIDKGFIVRITGDQTVSIPSLPFTILEGLNIEDVVVEYREEMGELQEIILIPKIRNPDGTQSTCSVKSDDFAINPC